MPYKLCPNCNQSSYSASDRGIWNCPNCGKDITFVPSTSEQIKKKNGIIRKKNNSKGQQKVYDSHLRLVLKN